MFNHFKKWRAQRLKLRLWQREQRHHVERQHQAWSLSINCLSCHTLVPQDARFCPMCGIPLQGPTQPATGPLVTQERPLTAYRRHLHPTTGPTTQVHRMIHIPQSKEAFETGAIKRLYNEIQEGKQK